MAISRDLAVVAERSAIALPANTEHPIALWLRNKQRVNTQQAYARTIDEFAQFLAEQRGTSDPLAAQFADLLAYREWLADPNRQPPLKTSTIVARLRALSALYSHLVAVGTLRVNPLAALDVPEITDAKVKRAWRTDEIIAFMQAIPAQAVGADLVQAARDRALFWLLFRNALRVSEAVGARVGDLDEEEGIRILRIREHSRDDQHVKRGKARVAVLKPETAQTLDTYLKLRGMYAGSEVYGDWRNAPLFAPARRTGRTTEASRNVPRFLTRREVLHLMHRYGERAGLDPEICHPHAARMTAIMALVRAGVDLAAVMGFSGHQSVATVKHYFDLHSDVANNAALRMPY